MKRIVLSLVAVLGFLVLTDTASASHRRYRGPQRGFSLSIGTGYYGGGFYSGYRSRYYGRPYYWSNGFYGGGYAYAPYGYSYSPSWYCSPRGTYYYGAPSYGVYIGR